MSKTSQEILEEILTIPTVKKLWTANYPLVLPFTLNEFSMGSVLPVVLYLFRWGHRRGKGNFEEKYCGSPKSISQNTPNIETVVEKLLTSDKFFSGFNSPAGEAILGDMLLSFCLENKKHKIGRTEKIQRAFPTHYLASWIDLPKLVATQLRFVPEMLCSLLSDQAKGEFICPNDNKHTHFSIAAGFEKNSLLSLFGTGMQIGGPRSSGLTSDHFLETEETIGLDQLLTIRVAQECSAAPGKMGVGGESGQISNQHPIATVAANSFREDFGILVIEYGKTIPRQTFLQMLESCMSIGLTNIYFSTAKMLLEWEKNGVLPTREEQSPWPLFVDCSSGNDLKLRRLSEESMSDFDRRFERFPIIMMCLRILDDRVRHDKKLKKDVLPSTSPDATEFINLLGSIFIGAHPHSERILNDLDERCANVADAFSDEKQESEIQNMLKMETNPVLKLAEAICMLTRNSTLRRQTKNTVFSVLMMDQPNGLGQRRKILQSAANGKKVTTDARSIVLTNTMLDFMVHRHLRQAAKSKGSKLLTFMDMVQILKRRYGLFVDEAPPGLSIPVETLLHNKRILERRLRDLGVLIGVNDAESMKRLRQRFQAVEDEQLQ